MTPREASLVFDRAVLDFAAAILTADSEGRDRAKAVLLADPSDAIDALGTLLLSTNFDDRPLRQIRHLSAMTELRDSLAVE